MLDELKTFITVVNLKNFTKAAEQISLSQPSVSQHIKSLEKTFNAVLIKRGIKQKSIEITPAGKILYDRAQQICKLYDYTLTEINELQEIISGQLHIGASFTIGEYFLPELLGEFSRLYPNLNLKITIENTSNICKKLAALEIDLALVEGAVADAYFDKTVFYLDQLVLITAIDNPLGTKKFKLSDWQHQTWITRELGSGSRQQLDTFLEESNITPNNLILFGSNFAVKEAVKNNLGVSFISKHIASLAKVQKEIHLVFPQQAHFREFSYLLPKNIPPTNTIKAFLANLKHSFVKYQPD